MLEADVTRPITIVSPDGTKQTIVQTVHLTRTATVDEETGDVIYGNWTTGQFKAYPVSDVDGYTTEVKYGDSAEAKRVDGDVKASDITITGQDADAKPENGEPVIVTYKLNDASGKISYQTSDGTEVGSQTISGKAGQTSTYKTTVPTGYELTDPNQTAVTVTYPTDGSQKTVVVTVQAKNDTYDNTGDKPDWVKEATTKDVTRTIHFAYPDSYTGTKHDDVVQTVHFTRTATKNEATGDVTYGDWTAQGSDQFDAFNAPDIHGYHPTSSALVVTGVKADGSYDDVTITYAPDDLVGRVIYKYTDKNGNVSVVGAQTVNGTTDESRQLTDGDLNVPKGYKLVDGEALPTINFKPGQTNEVTVNVDHVIEHFNSGDDIDSHKGDMPKGVDITAIKQGMTKTVTRTVYVTPVNGERHQVDQQTAHFKRGVTIDFATGAVIYDPSWTSDDATFKDASSEVAPAPTGYSIVSTHTYGQETVTANDNDIDVEVTYAAAKSHITIVAKDKSNNNETITIPSSISTTLDGQTAATVDPKNVQTYVDAISKALESEGYQFDSTDTFPTAFNGDTTLNIYFTHRIDDKTTNLPSGSEDVTKDVTRRIHVIAPDGQDYYIDQTVTATRQAKVDAVTHKVTGYTDWTIPELTSVTAPQYAGYTPSIASVESHTPTADEINAGHTDEVTITYTGLATTQSYEYIDADTGSQVGQTYQGANGKVGDKVNFDTEITTNIPNGYELLPGQTLPGEHELGQTNQTIKVYVRKTVVDDKNKTTTTPKGSDKSTLKDLSKTITRTVIAHVPGKDAQPIASQEVHFTRTATWNDATKSWDYSDWKVDGSQVWDAINDKDIPEVAGYTHTPVHVDSYNVLPSTQNQTVDITYTALDHTTHVIYKYGDLTINTKELTGKTGDTVQTNINDGIPENYELVPDQNLPENITFAADGHADIVVNLEHAQDHYDGKTGEKPAWATEDTTRTVTRTIHLVYPEGKKPEGAEDTHTDSATFTRTATRDKVTGQVTYSAWTLASGDANFKKFTAPEVANYTPSTSEIAAETVTADSPDTNYTITYNANGTNFTIKASDVTGDTPVDIPIPTGINPVITHKSDGSDNDEFSAKKAGVIAEIKQALAEKGYDFVGEDGNDTGLTLKFKHHENTYHQGDDIPEGDKDLIKEDLTKNVTRKVITTKPDGTKSEITQTVTATRTVTIDEATKTVTYGDWSLPSFEGSGVEQIKGYTSQVDGVNATTVASHQVTTDEITKGTASDVNVTYVANDHTMHIIYRDVDDGYKLVGDPITVTGKTNTTVDTNANVPAGYELVDGQTNPATVSFPADGSEVQDITVLVKHHVEGVDPNKPTNIPAGGDKDAIIKAGNKDVVRTIHYQKADGTKAFDDTTQTVHFTRIVKVDAVTGKIVGYGDWTKANPQPAGDSDHWSSVTVQTLAGYTPSQDSVQDQSVDADTNDKEITVVYTANTHMAHIIYQDADNNNKSIYSQNVYGQTDKTYTISQDTTNQDPSVIVTSVPTGYKLADGQSIPGSISFNADGAKDIVISLKHELVDAKTPTDVDTHKGDIPSGTDLDAIKQGMAKDVTRSIYETKPGESRKLLTKQTVHFTRTASIDRVTGKVTYGAWTPESGSWDAYPVQGVEGYEQVVTGGTLSETPVTGDMSDQDVEVTYTSQAAQDITVVARDVTDKTNPVDLGQTQSLHGNVDSPVSGKDLSDAIEKIRKALVAKGYNYQGVDGEIPVKFDNSKHTIVLDFTRATDEVPGGTTIPDKYKGIIADSDVTKTYTRTINLHYNVNGHEVVEHVTQPVTLTRTATVDLAKFAADPTDKTAVTYGAWTTADYPEYSIPDKAGYTPYVNDNETHSLAATPATDDVNVDVYYKGHEGTQIFKYIDAASGNQVGVDVKFTGNVGDSEQTYTYAVPAGYKLAKGQGTSSTYSFTDGINTTNIYLDHDVQEVTPTTIPEGSTDVTKADLTKTVTRTISYKYEDGTVAHDADVQTITLTRTAYVDPITHQVTYSNWTSDKSFTDVTAPIIDGYTPSKTEVLGHSVDGDSDNENITVTYTKKTQSTEIQYVDGDHKVIKTVTVTGKTGDPAQTVNVDDDNNKPSGWKLSGDAPKTITITFDNNHKPVEQITVEHDTRTYKSGDVNAPEGLDKTVTRTINFHKPAGNEQVVQTVHYTRTATVDLVSGDIKYNAWTIADVSGATKGEGTDASFDAISVPTVDGYTADHTQVEAQKVTPDTADSVVDVYYNANKTEIHFKAVDEKTGKDIDLLGSLTSPINVDVTTKDADSQVASREADIKQYLADKYTFDKVETSQDGNITTYTLKFNHATDTISKGGNLPEGVSESDFTKTVTRTINVHTPGQTDPEVITQTATAHRQLVVDKADGSYTWTPWVVDSQFGTYNVPQVAGYTSQVDGQDATSVDAVAVVQADDNDKTPQNGKTVEVTYTAQAASQKVIYIDAASGEEVSSFTAKGEGYVTDASVDFDDQIRTNKPENYDFVDESEFPGSHKLTAGENTPVRILVKTHKDTYHDGDKNIPTGVAALSREITRTINVYGKDGKTLNHIEVQTVKFTRTATVDAKSGAITYSDWTVSGDSYWNSFDASSYVDSGYTAQRDTHIASASVTSASHDVVIDIYEKANDHAATVTYIDQTDAKNPVTVMSYTVHGQTDQDVTVPNQVPHGYKLVDEDALPAIIHFTADGAKDVTVYLVHDTADDLNSPKIDDKTKKEIEANLTKTVTRTITVHEPGKDAKNLPAQTVSFHRTFSYDVLTGQVTYGDWTPDGSTTWVAITDKSLIPDVAGYTHNTVDEVRNITADTPDAHVDVVYTPEDAQPVTFKAVNDTKSGEEIAIPADVIKSITGKTDAVVPADKVSDVISGITTALTKQGYTYVSVEGIPTKYSASGSTVTLHFKQVPGTYSTGNIPDEFRQYVSDKDLNRDVTRTIIEHLPSGDKTLVQRVHLTRTVTVDTVAFRSATNDDAKTKAISFGAWTPADSSFDEYDFDQVAGYESQVDGKAQTKADTLAALSDGQPITDVTVNVDYVAQDASQPIVYVDVVTGKTVGNTSVGGKTGESVDINTPITQNIPTGYKLVDNQSFSTTTLGATNKPIKVLVTADTKPATEEQIKADHGVVEKTIKRTIHYVVEGSGVAAPEDVTQEVHFTRSATYNPTTGKVTYGEWTPKDGESNTWASVTTPTIAGYIPTVSGFDAVTVTDRDVDEDLTVTYKPEVRNYKVNYVDQNGNVIKTDTVTGKTGDTVQINSSTPFGWNLDDGQTIPTTATLDADDTKNVATVHVHQVTKTIKGSDDTHNDALNKTVTRTVIITDTRGEQTKQVQSVHFTRNQEINLATGETHYTDWTADGDDKFDAVTAPTVDGYTIVGQAPEVDGVKATDPDTTVNISYVANKQTDTFKAVDDDQNGEPISLPGSFTTTLKGDSDTPITQDQVDSVIKDINDYLTEKGYVSKAAPTITTDEQGNKTITLHFGHGTEDTSATDPAAKKTVTRTIQFIGAGKQSPVVQTITATRTATKDTVTGETKYGDWTGSFDKYNAPVLDGYTMTIDGQDSTDGVVPSVNVDKKAPQNVTVTVVYTGKQGQQTVHYIDADTGKEVQVDNPQVIRATVGSTQEVNFTAPKGYDLIPGQKTSEEITIPATDTGIDVFVKQHVDNYDSKNNPDNLELTKDVTRTIIVNKPNEAPQSIKQTVHFTRTASVNAATGATTYSAWTVDGTDSWDAYTADDVNGYTTYVDGKEGKDVASQTVTAYTGNQTVNITYTANAKSVQIVYVDKTGKQLGSQTINGHTGSTENVTPVLPSGYQVPKDGKQVPTTITFPGDGSDLTNITITVEPTQHTYNPGDKDLDKEVSAEVRDKMFKTVTRTVNIYVPNEKGQEVKTTIVQEVHFARPVTVYGDGTVQYAKTWTPQGETKFDAINVDNFRGYDASVDGTTPSEQVPEVDNIPAETPDSTIDVHYLPQDQKVRFKVVDITDNKEITDLNITNDLESPVITGKSGTEIPTDKVKAYVDQIKKLMEARGYEFDSAIYPSDFDKDKSVDQQVILNFRHAKKNFEGTDTIPDNVKKGDNTALTKSDLTRDVTRKIILHTPNGDVEFTQHVTAHRTATVDEVTHVATLGDWTTPDFASQDVPSYRGYTAKIGDTTVTSVSSAPVAYVNDEPQNASDVVVDYVGQTGATQIDFVDKDGKIVGSSKSFEGQVGHDVTISGVTVPDGWKLAEGSTIPSSATVYADGRHVKVLVVHDTENVPSTKIPDGTTRSDGSKLTETDLKHDIVRKITLNKPAGTEVVIQHVVWSREAIVDKVTHQVVGYTDWTLNTQTPTESQDGKTTTQYGPTWKPIHTDAIKVAGYTPTTDQVTEVTPGPNANNDEITINYVAQPATVKVIYHDDKDNKDVAFDTIIGKKDGSKSTYDYQVPNGYQLAGDKTSAEFSFDGEDHYLVDGGQAIDAKTPFIIHLTHKTETFDKTSHAGFDDSDFERTVERHVRIHIPEHLEDPSVLGSFLQPGQTFEVVQSVTYERTATKDDATGKIIFSDWTIADTSGNVTENDDGSVDFKAVEAGQLAGYTPMTSAQEVAKVTADSRVSDLDIYYVENGTTITISARDNDTKSYLTIPDELQTTLTFPDVTGKDQGQKSLQSDVTAITAYFEKKGYDYVDVTQDGNHYTINFKHHIDHFTGDTCPDIPSDLDSAIKQPLTADVHREIEVHLPGQTDPVIITQTVHAHRTVSVDRAKLAKGDADAVKYDDWVFDDGDKFKAMPEAIQGYKTLINGVEAKDKNGTVPEASAKDKGGNPADGQKVVVTYQADVANAQIHYIDTDDGNKEIGTAQEVSGHSDEQKTVDTKLPDGYEYVDPSQKQVTIKFSDDGSVVSVNVLLKHKKVTTDKVPEGIKKEDGTDLTDADLTKTVTRTFDVLAPEGSKVDVPDKQTVTYKRSVTYDPVTKTVQSFGDWTAEGTDTWSQVDVPQVKGYTSVVDGTPSQVVAKVDKPQSDVTVKITYKAGQQQIRVIAVDDKTGAPIIIPVDGQALQTIIYGQTKAIVDKAQAQSYIEAIIYRLTKLGWIYDGHTEVPTLFDDDSSKDQNIVIGFHAEIDDYKPNDKLPDGAKDPNNKADQIVREMTKTRTIIFKDEKENVTKKVEQKVDFVRDVFINKVTNQVDHYGDWQYKDSNVKTWDAYDINKPGYTATVIDTTDIKNPKPLAKSEIDKQVVDDKSSDIELTVTYTKNPVKEDSGNNHGGNTSSGENGHKSGNTPEISNGKGVKTTLRGIKTPKRATLRSSNLVGKNARKLPQTGSDKEASAALGLAALGMSSALAYASKRKKRRN
ncbi:LPXTG cell wall anchor domain-containing protein [Lactobacillus jensenii]|nr:LPXTG cell wall anchor domain-containing protein [Lactobacillus jensenii]MBW8448604.1 LPXTG cell wall anchor domain-containing protein [Lactobacillus jensenii]